MSSSTTAAGSREGPSLRQNSDYVTYWWSRAFAVLGSQITYISFPLLALSVSKNALHASIVTAVTYATPFLMAVPAGYVADRFPRRTVMLLADLTNAAAYLLVAMLVLAGRIATGHLAIAAGTVAAVSAMYAASSTALLPTIVGQDQVRRAVSVNDSRDFALALAGPIIGATLFLQSSHLPFLVNGVAFVLSGMLVAMIRVGRTSVDGDPRARGARWVLRGLSTVLRDRSIRTALGMLSVLSFVLTLNFFALIAFFEARDATVGSGVVVASQALGGLVGGLVASRLSKRLSPWLVFLAQGVMWTVTGVAVLVWQSVWITSLTLAATWLVTPSVRAVYQGYVAAVVPESDRGRVASAAMLATATTSPLGVLAAGALSVGGSLAAFQWVCGIAGTATLVFLIVSARSRREFLSAT